MITGETMNIERLKEIREDNDLTQKDIAKLLQVKQQQYSKYELGINVIPLEKIVILANYYNTTIDYLVGRTDEISPLPPSTIFTKKKK